jgi:hypothetical protein
MMGKYDRTYGQPETERQPAPVHPIWRGIGCLLMIILPVISYAGAVLLVRENIRQRWIQVPAELTGSIVLPYLGRIFFLDLAVTVMLVILGFSLLMVLYAMVARIVGPQRYGPYDVPPSQWR